MIYYELNQNFFCSDDINNHFVSDYPTHVLEPRLGLNVQLMNLHTAI